MYQAGAGTSHNMNTNEVLANRAAELLGEKLGNYKRIHPNDHVNMGQSTNDVYPTATRLAILFALKDLLTASARAVGPSRGEEPRVRGCPQDGAHASAGRGTHHARPGVWRLRRERRARNRRSRAHGVATARAEPRSNRRRYGAERRRRLHQARDHQPGALHRAAVAPFAESLSYHAEHGRRPRLFGRAPAAGRGGGKGRVRPSPAQHGAACRHRRDSIAGRAAGVVDHAGQGQPFGPRDGQPGVLPGDRMRRRDSGGRRLGPARVERDDARYRLECPARNDDPRAGDACARCDVRDGHRRRCRALSRAPGSQHGAGDSAQPAHRVRSNSRDRQARREDRTLDPRSGARTPADA